jgi:hypothetical protein
MSDDLRRQIVEAAIADLTDVQTAATQILIDKLASLRSGEQ